MRDASWMIDATCANPWVDPDWFFPAPGDERTLSTARQVCAMCPVRAQCADHAAAEGHESGVWAGRLRRQHGPSRNAPTMPTTGAIRRLRALALLGHSAADVAAHINRTSDEHVSASSLGQMRAGEHAMTSPLKHEAIRDAYIALAERECTCSTAPLVRRRAVRAGWPPPSAWAGRDIDDPNALPRISDRRSA